MKDCDLFFLLFGVIYLFVYYSMMIMTGSVDEDGVFTGRCSDSELLD